MQAVEELTKAIDRELQAAAAKVRRARPRASSPRHARAGRGR